MSQLEPPPQRPPPPKEDETKTWLQAIGLTIGLTTMVLAGVAAVIIVVALAVVGLVLWTCSSH